MKVIIAGGRKITNYNALVDAIHQFPWIITEIVSGGASGVDAMGERFSIENGVGCPTVFPAQWNDLASPGARVLRRADGSRYNANAGPQRNEKMAAYAGNSGGLILLWDGKSKGSKDMLKWAQKYGLHILQVLIK